MQKNIFIDIHILLAIISIFIMSYTGHIIYNFIYMVLAITTIFWHAKIRKEYLIYLMYISILIVMTMIFSHDSRFGYILYFIAGITLGYTICIYGVSKKWSSFLFITLSLFFIYKYLTVSNYNTEIFNGMSRNGIAIMMIWMFALSVISGASKKTISFFAIITFIISAFSGSRSGLFSASLLLLIPFVEGNKKEKIFILLIFILLALYFVNLEDLFSVVFDRLQRQGLTDPGRALVIQCYKDRFNLSTAILGINYDGGRYCGTLAVGTYALHNSYLDLQSLVGGVGFILVLYLLIKTLKRLYSLSFLYFITFLSILLRSATDDVLFFNKWDYILWAFIFIAIINIKAKYVLQKA